MDTQTSGAPAWEGAFRMLADFAREHTAAPGATGAAAREGIRLTARSLSVPRPLRERFYGLVEQTAGLLAAQVLGARMGELSETARKAAAVRRGLCAMAGLRELRLADTLESLFANPEIEAARPLFATVLDGLQNGLDPAALEERARAELVPHCDLLRRCAYEAWAYYGVVAALKPTAFWAVCSPDTVQVGAVKTDVVTVATQASSPTRRMPEAVFETADGRVFAMKSEAARELDFYGFKLKRRRDNSAGGDTANLVAHRVLLLWRLPSVDAVDAVADRDKMRLTPTDLMCEVLEPADMATPAYVSSFVERINAVRSRRPVQVLTAGEEGAFPEGMLDDPTVAPVEVRCVGFDAGRLAKVAALLDE